ncbi:hypothetical protein GCM10010912_09450 [Paenibacillus albidus]|uniref:Protein-glutamine gamma-glutamyltransferase n=2 Tax=Paenibacillus albidus TaxID=2041023 RepID=A0A917FCN2_9BACL|nr:protein-glutamine gamma-glutamyltransferase [Paenibacillus albidus]GGF66563.1 hypothetical protein GCM10010912_09450 [Paenibacillus albidus]
MAFMYNSPESLNFERRMRDNIIASARALNDSGADFATFKETRCNERLWTRTDNGGIQLREGVWPSAGINDIFWNGQWYAFECATAMVIILYKATLDTIGEQVFNTYFQNLFLWDWNYDNNLQLISTRRPQAFIPGDIVYFKNPDHDPGKPEWQGENAVLLGPNTYFGHGIGISTGEGIIAALNQERFPGSVTPAYLTDEGVHPDFEYIRTLSSRIAPPRARPGRFEPAVFARIGARAYIYKPKSGNQPDR